MTTDEIMALADKYATTRFIRPSSPREQYMAALGDDVQSLRQAIEALAKDAARYAFVRTADKVSISREAAKNPLAYDEAIDKAIEAAQAEQA